MASADKYTLDQEKDAVKDGAYFFEVGTNHQKRMLDMADEADRMLQFLTTQPNINEDVFGMLRAAAGKVRLLANKRMKQFLDLCEQNINPSPDQNTVTNDDLTGFFDMVYLEIKDINKSFEEIEVLKKNGWRLPGEILPPVRIPKPSRIPIFRGMGPKTNADKKN